MSIGPQLKEHCAQWLERIDDDDVEALRAILNLITLLYGRTSVAEYHRRYAGRRAKPTCSLCGVQGHKRGSRKCRGDSADRDIKPDNVIDLQARRAQDLIEALESTR